jgi:hypothetical protein
MYFFLFGASDLRCLLYGAPRRSNCSNVGCASAHQIHDVSIVVRQGAPYGYVLWGNPSILKEKDPWVGDGGRTHNPRIHSAMLRH